MNVGFDTRWYFAMSATSKPGLFSNGDTTAYFGESGRRPSANDALTMLVMYGKSRSMNSRTRKVGTRSSEQDLIRDVVTMHRTSAGIHGQNDDSADGVLDTTSGAGRSAVAPRISSIVLEK